MCPSIFLYIFVLINKKKTSYRDMKRFIITISAALCFIAAASAQPRAIGARIGATGFDATYQHSMNSDQFIEGNIGLDFGYNANGKAGFKATAIYNFIWARPAWTEKGSWALYAGPGVSIGGVNDMAVYKLGKERLGYLDGGFMLSAALQVGLEYNFDFPLQLSVDIRPYIGLHINDGEYYDVVAQETRKYGSTVGFYDNGIMGLIPTISVRYRF